MPNYRVVEYGTNVTEAAFTDWNKLQAAVVRYSNNPSIAMSVRDGQVVLSGKLIKREWTVTADNPNMALAAFLTQYSDQPIDFASIELQILT